MIFLKYLTSSLLKKKLSCKKTLFQYNVHEKRTFLLKALKLLKGNTVLT